MREIKFRIWDNHDKKMRTWEQINEFYHKWLVGLFTDHDDTAYVMQYTGLKDKNGKEIYEGDILKGKFNGSVVWTGDRYNNGWSDYWNESEIIGNIYENPELLPTQPQQ